MALFTKNDVGCIVDGARGHVAVRQALSKYMDHLASEGASYLPQSQKRGAADVAQMLREEMSDDAWEEIEAIDLLNLSATDGVVMLEMVDGDLMCVARD